MRRRAYLTASTLSLTALAGCSGLLGGGNDAGDDPEATAVAFIEALNDGDRERANELLHPETPGQEVTEEGASQNAEVDINIDDTEVLTSDDDVAEVRVDLTISGPDSEQSESHSIVYELRTHDSNWRIWSQGSADEQ
ncbi:hypothetical protein [Haloarchaeobius sp. FL176]|uniref:hypothetical protein n=1 Tax=Haloarchaeobius sp. FL176 TaxID=2967129 RepID=UPI002148D3BA|nr:hypothetical protein [Haloarchaeobius sp. FL176]